MNRVVGIQASFTIDPERADQIAKTLAAAAPGELTDRIDAQPLAIPPTRRLVSRRSGFADGGATPLLVILDRGGADGHPDRRDPSWSHATARVRPEPGS